jgi:hypothetical protein
MWTVYRRDRSIGTIFNQVAIEALSISADFTVLPPLHKG